MNKGLEIRNNKLKRNAEKRNSIKPEQEDICRFVTIRYEVIKRINGKYKRVGSDIVNGLQIKNRVYKTDGSYKLINGKGIKIQKKFDSIPEWATEDLIKKYEGFLSK